MARFLIIVFVGLFAMPVFAEDESSYFGFGGDSFLAGRSLSHQADGADDLFMAGETVAGRADITGSAHLAGRDVTMQGAVGGDVYAMGEEVALTGDVGGDATVIGRAVSAAGVGGDLRIAGSEVRLGGDVGGYAMVAGEDVAFGAAVAGDVSLAAQEVMWGEVAAIAGRLIVYEEEPGTLQVPERVVPEDRIERRKIEDWDGPRPPDWRRVIAGFLLGVIVVAGLAALIATLVPQHLAGMRRQILARPFHTLWLGFLTQSAVIGSAVLFAMTIIGLLLTPAMILLAFVGGFAGYVVAAYAFGVGLLLAFGRGEPDSIGERAMSAGVGALAAGLVGLIPFLGWLFVLALVLTGIGAITLKVIRPVFFADPPY
ncbi:MAG: hypothetical protein QNJ44_06150 [Rhodobacter sp.]|nr:hypothetical protein [Rhodobacter sp.]